MEVTVLLSSYDITTVAMKLHFQAVVEFKNAKIVTVNPTLHIY